MSAMRSLSAVALVAGAFVLGAAAATAQVKITGKETNLANHSAYGGPAGDLPPAPKIATAPAAGPEGNGPMQLKNINVNLQIANFTSVAVPKNSPRAPRRALGPNLKAQTRK